MFIKEELQNCPSSQLGNDGSSCGQTHQPQVWVSMKSETIYVKEEPDMVLEEFTDGENVSDFIEAHLSSSIKFHVAYLILLPWSLS